MKLQELSVVSSVIIIFFLFCNMKVACFSHCCKEHEGNCWHCNISRCVSSPLCAFSLSSNEYINSHSYHRASLRSLSNSLLVLALRMISDKGLMDLCVLTRLMGTASFTGPHFTGSCLILWGRKAQSLSGEVEKFGEWLLKNDYSEDYVRVCLSAQALGF